MNYYDEYSKGHVVLPNVFLAHFSKLFPSAFDFLIWLYFFENQDIAPSEIAEKTGKKLSEVNQAIDNLSKFGAMMKFWVVLLRVQLQRMKKFKKRGSLKN